MPTKQECVCCHSIAEVDRKRQEKCVKCITKYPGFRANCLDLDELETSYYEYKEAHGPPAENQLIHE